MSAAQAIKKYRKDAGLTQQRFADLIGVARETVGRWEADIRKPDEELLQKLSDTTGIQRKVLRPDLAESLGVDQ